MKIKENKVFDTGSSQTSIAYIYTKGIRTLRYNIEVVRAYINNSLKLKTTRRTSLVSSSLLINKTSRKYSPRAMEKGVEYFLVI